MIIGKGAGVILTDSQGKILLQHRDSNALWHPNYWGIFGGQIEENETPEQAAIREIKEEIGIELADLKFFKRYEIKREKGIYQAFFFTATPLDFPVEKLRSQQTEGQGLEFFNFSEVKDLKVTDLTSLALRDFFEKKYENNKKI